MGAWKTQQTHSIDSEDFDALVTATYGRTYESVAENEWNNDSSYTANIVPNWPLDDYDSDKLAEWVETGRGMFLYQTILQDMANRNLIPTGKWIISVSW